MLTKKVECLVRQRLDVNRQFGVVEIDVPAARFLDSAANLALDLRRGHRESLIRPPHRDPEGSRILRLEIAQDLGRDGVEVERRAPGAGEVPRAEYLPQTVAHRFPIRVCPEHDFDSPLERTHLADVEIGGRLADVLHQARDEPWPVPALQRDLGVVNDD